VALQKQKHCAQGNFVHWGNDGAASFFDDQRNGVENCKTIELLGIENERVQEKSTGKSFFAATNGGFVMSGNIGLVDSAIRERGGGGSNFFTESQQHSNMPYEDANDTLDAAAAAAAGSASSWRQLKDSPGETPLFFLQPTDLAAPDTCMSTPSSNKGLLQFARCSRSGTGTGTRTADPLFRGSAAGTAFDVDEVDVPSIVAAATASALCNRKFQLEDSASPPAPAPAPVPVPLALAATWASRVVAAPTSQRRGLVLEKSQGSGSGSRYLGADQADPWFDPQAQQQQQQSGAKGGLWARRLSAELQPPPTRPLMQHECPHHYSHRLLGHDQELEQDQVWRQDCELHQPLSHSSSFTRHPLPRALWS
jgi:hypothetical protein